MMAVQVHRNTLNRQTEAKTTTLSLSFSLCYRSCRCHWRWVISTLTCGGFSLFLSSPLIPLQSHSEDNCCGKSNPVLLLKTLQTVIFIKNPLIYQVQPNHNQNHFSNLHVSYESFHYYSGYRIPAKDSTFCLSNYISNNVFNFFAFFKKLTK